MQFFNILVFTIRRLLGDTKNNLIKIGMPILLMSILGSALSSAFEADDYDITYVGYVNDDEGETAESILEMLSEDSTIENLIEFKEVNTLAEGQDLVRENELSAILFFGEDFSKNYNSEEEVSIEVYSSEYSGTSMIVVKNVLDSYANIVNAVNTLADAEQYEIANNFSYEEFEGINEKPLNNTNDVTSAIDYFAVTMLVFVLFYGTQYGCECIGEDYIGNIGKRIMSSPVKLSSYFAGKVTGVCIVNFIQGIVLMLVATYGYGVSWGSNLTIILLLAFCFSVLVTSIGAFICMITKDASKASSILTILVPALTFISGGFTKFDSGLIKYISPGYYVQNGIFSVIYNGSKTHILNSFAVVLGLTLVIGFITVMMGRRMAK